jgi:glycosyltransferase involved in cell wall biosynthesis
MASEFDPRMLRLRRTTDLARRRLRAQDRRTVAHVDSFAANSSAVRDRIRRFYQRDARVIFPPVDTEFYTPGAAPSRDFVLAVSRFIPYKRIDFAIEAAATARVRLVIAGSGPQEGELRRLARRAGGDVTFVISPTDEHLRELYRNALALVFPPMRISASWRWRLKPAERRSLPSTPAEPATRSWPGHGSPLRSP